MVSSLTPGGVTPVRAQASEADWGSLREKQAFTDIDIFFLSGTKVLASVRLRFPNSSTLSGQNSLQEAVK